MAMSIYQFPAQKKLLSQKTEQWRKDNIEAAITIVNSDTSKLRKSRTEKKINYDLVNGIIDEADIEKAFNPMGIRGVAFPAKIQNYPIEISKLNVLKGEESKRRFDWTVRSVNEDVISQKEFIMQQQMYDMIVEELNNDMYSEEMVTRRVKQLEHYQKYEYQDYAEVMGSRILDYFWHTQRLKHIFSDGFWDVLISAEEIYSVDIIHGEPKLSRRNPLNITTFGSGDSHKIEDSDIIVEDGFMPVGQVIDEFWDVLDDDEVKDLEEGARRTRYWGDKVLPGPIDVAQEATDLSTSQLITVDGKDANYYGGWFDSDGNVRRTRVIWRSRRKIGKLTYYDQAGEEFVTIIDENFPVDKFKQYGWKVDWYWINEWWQGYKIGADMYKRMEPLPRIGATFNNPSYCLPPIIGTIYSVGGGRSVSLMDRIKPYKYLYNVYMRRTELASARNKGVLAELDLAEIPDDWDEEMVMMFAEANGYMVHDSFKEGKKGIAQGKLVSTIKQRGPVAMNLNSSDIIRANLELARYVKLELGEISGISPQREGQIDNRETYGGVERSVTQSSHITEEWFRVHDLTKLRALELMLETAKYAWRNATDGTKKKLQYVDDGMITHLFKVDGRVLAETEYGYYVSDGQNDAELIQNIKQLSHAALQNDKIKFKDIFSIHRDTSVSSMIRKLEASEDKAEEREDQIRREQLESNERIQQAISQMEQMKMEQTERIEMSKIDAQIYEAELQFQAAMARISGEGNGNDMEKQKADLEKLRLQLEDKRKEREQKQRQFDAQLKQKREEVDKKIASQEKIAKQRPKPVAAKT